MLGSVEGKPREPPPQGTGNPLTHSKELCAARLLISSQQQISKQWERLNTQLAPDGIIHGCVQARSCSLCMRCCLAGMCWSHFCSRDSWLWLHVLLKLLMIPTWHWPATANKDSPISPTSPSVSKTFLQCFFPIFIIALCYNTATQHIHIQYI